jgi:phenylpropionate dioxygenase-like ring-hydroxylating dioxygenase large terminal subunit
MAASDFIPNQWYPVFDSSKLKARKPVGITRLGERLVLWRDSSGAAVCMTDRCPHRAAQLSLGWVRDGCLVCPFHGLRFNSTGGCVMIPANGETQPVPRGFDLPTRPIREAHGLIWYWYGDSEPAAEIPWFPEAPDPGSRTSFVQREYPVSYLRVMENLGDMHHIPFVHRATIPGAGTRVQVQEARLDGDVIRMRVSLHHERPGRMRPVYNFTYALRLPHPRHDSGRARSAVRCQRDADRSRQHVAVGAIWAELYPAMAGRQDSHAAGREVRHGAGLHSSGHANARQPAAQSS